MKTCPVCNARAFDDADTCYGCLYRFGDAEAATDELSAAAVAARAEKPEGYGAADEQDGSERRRLQLGELGALPAFQIRFMPVADDMGGLAWSCFVEQC